MSFHYPTVNYQIPLHFRLKRGEPPLKDRTNANQITSNLFFSLWREHTHTQTKAKFFSKPLFWNFILSIRK